MKQKSAYYPPYIHVINVSAPYLLAGSNNSRLSVENPSDENYWGDPSLAD